MNRKKTARIMRRYGIKAEYLKHYKYSYSKRHVEGNVRCDLLRRNFNQRGWVTDITYLQLTRNSKNLEEYIQLVIEWLYFYNTTRLRQTKK